MEKRIGVIAILVTNKEHVPEINERLSAYSHIVLARLGLPLPQKGVNVISLVVEGTNDEIGALTGKLGQLDGVQVKSMLTAFKENDDNTKVS